MKRIGKLLAAMGIALVICLVAQSALPQTLGIVTSAQAASRVKLNRTSAKLYAGETLKMKVSGVKSGKVTWASSNKRVAKVNKRGVVTAIKPGKARIVAKVGSKKFTCKVTVMEFPPIWPIPVVVKKPVLYLYPEVEKEITVKLGRPENLTASYPAYADGWRVLARPDGALTDLDSGRSLYSLYWEGRLEAVPRMDEGFVVAGEDTAAFLEEKLAVLGLTEREAEELIIYWLPNMQGNPYNLIRFESREEIDSAMPLEFSAEPDALIRVYMVYKPLEAYVELPEQVLPEPPARAGFTAVEWGGIEIR